jgi:hypothetical protein
MKHVFAFSLVHGALGVVVSISLMSTGCKPESVGPSSSLIPGRRDYVWSIDTLAYPSSIQTLMRSIWGSSSNDVYAVGHNASNNGMMYHYDGIKWSPVTLSSVLGGPIHAGIDLMAIHGLSGNDIWAVGANTRHNPNPPPNYFDSSLIIHFDGTGWKQIYAGGNYGLNCIWVVSSTEVWAGGPNGCSASNPSGQKWCRK